MTNKVRVDVDRSKCMGTMSCIYTAKGLFQLIDGKAQVKDKHQHNLETMIEAAEACPVGAISVIDELEGKVLFP